MKSIIKKLLLILGLGAGLFISAPAFAAAPSGSITNYEIGISSAAATFFQVTTSPGYFLGIAVSSAAAGDYAVCFDSGSTSGLTTTIDGTSTAPRLPTAFAVQVGTITIVTASTPPGMPPLGFANGLACAVTAQRHVDVFYRVP